MNEKEPVVGGQKHARLSRRRFLRKAGDALLGALALPSLVPARALGRDGTVAPSNRIALGVVGLSQGWVDLERCLQFDDVQGVAACDTDSYRLNSGVSRINAHYNGKVARGYNDFREMFATAGLDAVILAAPDHWHGIMAVRALRAGLDVFGEKPLAHTLSEGRAVVDAVRQHGRVWQTGSWQRSVWNFRQAAELVRNGRIGKVTHVEIGTYGGGTSKRPKPRDFGHPPRHLDYAMWVGPAAWTDYDSRVTHGSWRYVLNYGGGKLLDWVGHHGDIAQWALGFDHTGPVKISGSGSFETAEPYDVATKYRCEFIYENGVTMVVSSEFQPGTKFYGEHGWIFVTRGRGLNGKRSIEASDPALLNASDDPGEIHVYRSDDHWRNFIDCIKNRRETVAPVEAAQRASSLGHLGHIAMLTGRTLQWDPASETLKNDPSATTLLGPAFRSPWTL